MGLVGNIAFHNALDGILPVVEKRDFVAGFFAERFGQVASQEDAFFIQIRQIRSAILGDVQRLHGGRIGHPTLNQNAANAQIVERREIDQARIDLLHARDFGDIVAQRLGQGTAQSLLDRAAEQ